LQNEAVILSWVASAFTFVVPDVRLAIPFKESPTLPYTDYKQSPHYWLIPADSAALTPEPRPMENDLRHSLKSERIKEGGLLTADS